MIDFVRDFERDTEFLKLLSRRDSEVDLTLAALEFARDGNKDLDFAPVLEWVAERANELASPIARASGDEAILEALVECLAVRERLNGDPSAYETPQGSFLNWVVETRSGIPISLSVLYLAVAQRVGIDLQGVCAPGHFLVRHDTLHQPLFIDAFNKGRILTFKECVQELLNRPELNLDKQSARQSLEASGPRPILIRMLNNLKAVTAKIEDWRLCQRVQHRLLALHPAQYSERRDWGLITLKAGQPGPALTMLEQCLKQCPADEKRILTEHVKFAQGIVSRYN